MLDLNEQLYHLCIVLQSLGWVGAFRQQVRVRKKVDRSSFWNWPDLDTVIVHVRRKPSIPESQHRLQDIGEVARGHSEIATLCCPINAAQEFACLQRHL